MAMATLFAVTPSCRDEAPPPAATGASAASVWSSAAPTEPAVDYRKDPAFQAAMASDDPLSRYALADRVGALVLARALEDPDAAGVAAASLRVAEDADAAFGVLADLLDAGRRRRQTGGAAPAISDVDLIELVSDLAAVPVGTRDPVFPEEVARCAEAAAAWRDDAKAAPEVRASADRAVRAFARRGAAMR